MPGTRPELNASHAVRDSLTYYDTRALFRDHEQWAGASNLRRDPRKNSTTAIHLHGRGGALDDTGRPLGEQRMFFLGPGPKIIGSDLRYSYPERSTGKVKLDKSLDPREILNQFNTGRLGGSRNGGEPSEAGNSQAGGGASRPHTAPAGSARLQAGGPSPNPAELPKTLWNDGRNVHVLEGVAPRLDQTGRPVMSQQAAWRPPRVEHKHLEPGVRLGQVEMPSGTDTKLVGSKYRYMPNLTADPPPGPDVSTYSAESLGRQSLANSVRSYAQTYKPIGYKEYEARAKNMEGLGCWDFTGGPLTSSMRVGRPSTLLGPSQHVTERLSLRRPATTRSW